MKKLFVLSLILAFPFISHSQSVDSNTWVKVLNNVVIHGASSEVMFGTVKTLTVKENLNDQEKISYLSIAGDNEAELFVVKMVSLVEETWVKNGEVWEIDQWAYLLSSDGQLQNVWHRQIHKSTSGSILKLDAKILEPPLSAAEIQRFFAFLKKWMDQ